MAAEAADLARQEPAVPEEPMAAGGEVSNRCAMAKAKTSQRREVVMLNYKYKPEDYRQYDFMFEDMTEYYRFLEAYHNDRTPIKKIEAGTKLEALYFTIKHRELDSGFDHNIAESMRDYFGGLLND